jgi:hypothetical protein
MINAVLAVQAVQEARKRIPDEYKHLSYFGAYDLWYYIDTPNTTPGHSECETCMQFRAHNFAGNQLRQYFPDLTIESENLIYPNVHMTLWGTDTCKCTLIRVTDNPDFNDPSKVLSYEGVKIEPYKPKDDEDE